MLRRTITIEEGTKVGTRKWRMVTDIDGVTKEILEQEYACGSLPLEQDHADAKALKRIASHIY